MNTARVITVHKEGEEGTLQVRHADGKILTPLDQRPDWAEGLAVALTQERNTFYQKRLGEANSPFGSQLESILGADVVAFQDMGWLGVNAEQQELEVSADGEYRSEVMAKILGIDTEEGSMGQGVTAEREIMSQRERLSLEESDALREGMEAGFSTQTQVEKDTATG
jgi:hypothetical protein